LASAIFLNKFTLANRRLTEILIDQGAIRSGVPLGGECERAFLPFRDGVIFE